MGLKIEVLMSVYHREDARFLACALHSLEAQTRPADAVLIVEDGPLTPALTAVLDRAEQRLPNMRRLKLPQNRGLGLALKEGVLACTCPWILRMDSDDICHPERIAIQEAYLLEHPDIDVLGTQIKEFESIRALPPEIQAMEPPLEKDPYADCFPAGKQRDHGVEDERAVSTELLTRMVPLTHEEIVRYQRRRSALNHVSVLMRREAVLKAGNYEHGLLMEDDLLWYNMIQHGARMANLPEALVAVRVSAGVYERRGGFTYLKHYYRARQKAYQRGQIGLVDHLLTLAVQVAVTLVPERLRKWIFQRLLRCR